MEIVEIDCTERSGTREGTRMAVDAWPGAGTLGSAETLSLEERLERGEVVHIGVPVPLTGGRGSGFLLTQRLGSGASKTSVTIDVPSVRRGSGPGIRSMRSVWPANLLADFSRVATTWLKSMLPRYATAWQLDRVSFRPEEEATRRLRVKARERPVARGRLSESAHERPSDSAAVRQC